MNWPTNFKLHSKIDDSWAYRIVSITGLISFLAAFAVCCVYIIQDRKEVLTQATAEIGRVAAGSATLVDQLVRDVDSLASGFQTSVHLTQGPFDTFLERNANWLLDAAEANPVIGGFVVLNAEGIVMTGNVPELVGKSLSFRRYFTVFQGSDRGHKFVSEPIVARSNAGTRLFLISWPLRDQEGSFLGVLAMSLETSVLEGLLTQVENVSDDTISIVLQSGAVLATLNNEGSQALEVTHREPLLTDIVLHSTSHARPQANVTPGTLWGSQGNWMLAGAPFNSFVGAIVATRDKHVVLASWRQHTFFAILIFLIAAASMTGVVVLLHNIIRHRSDEIEIAIKAASTDSLTGLYNRRVFDDRADIEWSRAQRDGYCISLILFDLDKFKAVNDTFGHAAGDEVLKAVGQCVLPLIRRGDVFARTGGEEFAILLPKMSKKTVLAFSDRLLRSIEQLDVDYDGQKISVTASGGICVPDVNRVSVIDALRIADEALYEAKNRGRNQVVLSDDGMANTPVHQVAAE